MKDAFFKHGHKEPLRSCVKAINFCCAKSKGELQDFARTKLKELEDELNTKLNSAIKEVVVYYNELHCFLSIADLNTHWRNLTCSETAGWW